MRISRISRIIFLAHTCIMAFAYAEFACAEGGPVTAVHAPVAIQGEIPQYAFSSTWFADPHFGVASMTLAPLTLEQESFRNSADVEHASAVRVTRPAVPANCQVEVKGSLKRGGESVLGIQFTGAPCEPIVSTLDARTLMIEFDDVPADSGSPTGTLLPHLTLKVDGN